MVLVYSGPYSESMQCKMYIFYIYYNVKIFATTTTQSRVSNLQRFCDGNETIQRILFFIGGGSQNRHDSVGNFIQLTFLYLV